MDRSMAPLESHLPKAINNGPSSIWKSLAATWWAALDLQTIHWALKLRAMFKPLGAILIIMPKVRAA
jgi:hypothetical protein